MTLAWLVREQLLNLHSKKPTDIRQMAQGDEIIPIPGTSSKQNFVENIGALKVKLTENEVREIRKLVDEAEVVGERYPPG